MSLKCPCWFSSSKSKGAAAIFCIGHAKGIPPFSNSKVSPYQLGRRGECTMRLYRPDLLYLSLDNSEAERPVHDSE